jgi:hypothetical protein
MATPSRGGGAEQRPRLAAPSSAHRVREALAALRHRQPPRRGLQVVGPVPPPRPSSTQHPATRSATHISSATPAMDPPPSPCARVSCVSVTRKAHRRSSNTTSDLLALKPRPRHHCRWPTYSRRLTSATDCAAPPSPSRCPRSSMHTCNARHAAPQARQQQQQQQQQQQSLGLSNAPRPRPDPQRAHWPGAAPTHRHGHAAAAGGADAVRSVSPGHPAARARVCAWRRAHCPGNGRRSARGAGKAAPRESAVAAPTSAARHRR